MSRGNYHKWTDEEEVILVRYIDQHGMRWGEIQKQYFQDLSIVQIRNKYYMLQKYHPQIIEREKRQAKLACSEDINEVVLFLQKLISSK